MGLGKALLKRGVEVFCAEKGNPITIQGYVKKENEPSNRSFQDAGFLEAGEKSIDEIHVINSHIIYQLQFIPTKS